MIKENKVVKYLLYAIGEIVLVILGILIALQINSANEVKKDRLLEQQYYCRLLEDVEQDKEQIILLISDAQERLEDSNKTYRRVAEACCQSFFSGCWHLFRERRIYQLDRSSIKISRLRMA